MPPVYVVATDLSAPSRSALAAAAALARRTGASLELFCAVPAALVDATGSLVERVQKGVQRLAERTTAQGVPTRAVVRVAEDIPSAIVAHAERIRADLVAVGPSGVSGWRRLLLGSVTERLLRTCPAPLLVARGRAPTFRRVLVALDMGRGASAAFGAALGIAQATGAKVLALHVVAAPGAALLAAGDLYLPDTWAVEAERVRVSQRAFARWVDGLDKGGADVEARVVEGNAADRILAEAAASGSSLVVLASHGHGFVHDLFVGSVARAVSTHAPMSVLVVRARSARGVRPARGPRKTRTAGRGAR